MFLRECPPAPRASSGTVGEVIDLEQFRAQAVVDVMGVVGDVVGNGGGLRLRAGVAPERDVQRLRQLLDHGRDAADPIAPDRRTVSAGERTVVLEQPFERFPGQVETVEFRIAPLQRA